MSKCQHGATDGECKIDGCEHCPAWTLDHIAAAFNLENFEKGQRVTIPYRQTYRALMELKELRDLRKQVELTLTGCKHSVRVREGGGPEDLAMSLAVTIVKLEREIERLRGVHEQPLDQLCATLPDLKPGFREEIEQESIAGLQRRVLVLANWIGFVERIEGALDSLDIESTRKSKKPKKT